MLLTLFHTGAKMSSQVQSRRFICEFNFSPQSIASVTEMLKKDENVLYCKFSDSFVYLETKTKKSLSYFVKKYASLQLIRVCNCNIPQANNVSEFGKPMVVSKRNGVSSKLTLAEKLDSTYRYVLENKRTPENLEDDVTAMINKTDFNKVINVAKRKIRAMEYDLELRPWKKSPIPYFGSK